MSTSLLDYYKEHRFNPVSLGIEDADTWSDHVRKRHNLYQNHLCIPMGLLAGKRILEYGCNSGENAVVLARSGARLVLVEPNDQVIPRLHQLLDRFSVAAQVDEIRVCGIEEISDTGTYDMVIAEGFLHALPERDRMLRRICAQLSPGGLGVISFDHRHGGLLELLKQAMFFRVLEVAGIGDPHSPPSLEIARQLFEEDYARLSASRDFFSWWKDSIVNPVSAGNCYWDYEDILPVIASRNCDFYSTSPRFVTADFFSWYKDVGDRKQRQARVLRQIGRLTPYFVTGNPDLADSARFTASPDLTRPAAELSRAMVAFTNRELAFEKIAGKLELFELLSTHEDPATRRLATEALRLFHVLQASSMDAMLAAWQGAVELRLRWGVPYHYLAFVRSQ